MHKYRESFDSKVEGIRSRGKKHKTLGSMGATLGFNEVCIGITLRLVSAHAERLVKTSYILSYQEHILLPLRPCTSHQHPMPTVWLAAAHLE